MSQGDVPDGDGAIAHQRAPGEVAHFTSKRPPSSASTTRSTASRSPDDARCVRGVNARQICTSKDEPGRQSYAAKVR